MPQVSDADLERKLVLVQRELSEALERQTATGEVLRVIASSPGELEPVFQAMLANAVRICEANFGVLFRFEDGAAGAVAMLRGAAGIFRILATRSTATWSKHCPRPRRRNEADGSYCRCQGGAGVRRG